MVFLQKPYDPRIDAGFMPGFLRRFTTDPALVDMGVTYSTIVFLFSLVNMADLAFEKIFQSVGRMNVAMVALITGCVTNIALDPVLIFGLGPVPALGIAGAALATGIGQAVSLVVYLYVYCSRPSICAGRPCGLTSLSKAVSTPSVCLPS